MDKQFIDFKNMVLDEENKGNVCVFTIEGLMKMPVKDIVNQPAEGILYDLNRDRVTVLTFIEDKKWVNDYACGLVIVELKRQLDEAYKLINTNNNPAGIKRRVKNETR